jgi:hypothetical protein
LWSRCGPRCSGARARCPCRCDSYDHRPKKTWDITAENNLRKKYFPPPFCNKLLFWQCPLAKDQNYLVVAVVFRTFR